MYRQTLKNSGKLTFLTNQPPITMLTHETQIRVRYGEVDQMGFLYHSHYVEYFDVARNDMMNHLGIPNTEIERDGVMLPVTRVEIDYRIPAHFDDLLTVRTTLRQMPSATIKFDYQVLDATGECHTTGSVTLAFMQSDTKKACRPPKKFYDTLKAKFDQYNQ